MRIRANKSTGDYISIRIKYSRSNQPDAVVGIYAKPAGARFVEKIACVPGVSFGPMGSDTGARKVLGCFGISQVIKKDGTRVPFDRTRIRAGIEKACYKRPVSNEQIDQVVADVEASIYEDGLRELPSRQIGELVFNALRDLDKVAFVRFASVYREFQDVNDFVDELQPILDGRERG